MSTEVAVRPEVRADTLEKVLLGGNLSVLSPAERMTYYKAVCESVGLNPLTRPFEYLNLNGKLVLYARRDATEQLRKIHGVSIGKLEKTFHDDLYIVEAPATDKTGRSDTSTGAVNIKGLAGEQLANAIMKCETKAKRRVTLSICGLGLLDETEVESIAGAVKVPVVEPPEDVPAVDVKADVEEDAVDLGALAEEVPNPDPTLVKIAQEQFGRPRVTAENKDFCDKMSLAKALLTKLKHPEEYYAVLGSHGYSHSWEVPGGQPNLRKTILDELRVIVRKIQAEKKEKP